MILEIFKIGLSDGKMLMLGEFAHQATFDNVAFVKTQDRRGKSTAVKLENYRLPEAGGQRKLDELRNLTVLRHRVSR